MEKTATFLDGATGFFFIMFFCGLIVGTQPFVPAIIIAVATHITARILNIYAKRKKDKQK
jgi:hypothetical protein